ncbi:hypothetical protein OKW34_004321 [Paraburkholderia youngii]
MHAIRVPLPHDATSCNVIRDRGQLQREVPQHRRRTCKLLVTLGYWGRVDSRKFTARLARGEVRCHDGTPLSLELQRRLLRECEQLVLLKQ